VDGQITACSMTSDIVCLWSSEFFFVECSPLAL